VLKPDLHDLFGQLPTFRSLDAFGVDSTIIWMLCSTTSGPTAITHGELIALPGLPMLLSTKAMVIDWGSFHGGISLQQCAQRHWTLNEKADRNIARCRQA